MKVAVIGAEGMLGSDMLKALEGSGCEATGFNRRELNITDYFGGFETISKLCPEVIINCAAYTDVDGAEDNKNEALSINGLGARNLSLMARAIDATLVHFSTDFIFDGRKEEPYHIFDRPNPVNYYGFSKYVGEQYVCSLCPKHYLVRTSWLFGTNGNNFVKSILRAAKEKEFLAVVDDQVGSPTYSKDLARAIVKLINVPFFGIYHVTNQGWVSWYDFAEKICGFAGIDIEIKRIKTRELKRPAQRPLNSRLDSFPMQESCGELLPQWDDALQRYMNV